MLMSMTKALDQTEAILTETGLINASGAVLYSGASTLSRGPVYLLGLNPGGSDGPTLGDSILASRREHNCYLDEEWAPGGHVQPMGQATLQRRVQDLCLKLKLNTRNVPASNLVFTRSTRLSTHSSFKTTAQACLVVHKIFLEAIQPDLLFTFGSIGNFEGFGKIEQLESRSANHGTWMAHRGKVAISGKSVRFANIPHMSLWASDRRPEVIDWVLN